MHQYVQPVPASEPHKTAGTRNRKKKHETERVKPASERDAAINSGYINTLGTTAPWCWGEQIPEIRRQEALCKALDGGYCLSQLRQGKSKFRRMFV